MRVLVVGNSLLDVLGGGRAGEPTDKNLGVLVTARAAVWRLLARFAPRPCEACPADVRPKRRGARAGAHVRGCQRIAALRSVTRWRFSPSSSPRAPPSCRLGIQRLSGRGRDTGCTMPAVHRSSASAPPRLWVGLVTSLLQARRSRLTLARAGWSSTRSRTRELASATKCGRLRSPWLSSCAALAGAR